MNGKCMIDSAKNMGLTIGVAYGCLISRVKESATVSWMAYYCFPKNGSLSSWKLNILIARKLIGSWRISISPSLGAG